MRCGEAGKIDIERRAHVVLERGGLVNGRVEYVAAGMWVWSRLGSEMLFIRMGLGRERGSCS